MFDVLKSRVFTFICGNVFVCLISRFVSITWVHFSYRHVLTGKTHPIHLFSRFLHICDVRAISEMDEKINQNILNELKKSVRSHTEGDFWLIGLFA